jgi:hypothetical protein
MGAHRGALALERGGGGIESMIAFSDELGATVAGGALHRGGEQVEA